MNKFYKFMYHIFYTTLCPHPDRAIFGSLYITQFFYNLTGKIAYYFHKKNCLECKLKEK